MKIDSWFVGLELDEISKEHSWYMQGTYTNLRKDEGALHT